MGGKEGLLTEFPLGYAVLDAASFVGAGYFGPIVFGRIAACFRAGRGA